MCRASSQTAQNTSISIPPNSSVSMTTTTFASAALQSEALTQLPLNYLFFIDFPTTSGALFPTNPSALLTASIACCNQHAATFLLLRLPAQGLETTTPTLFRRYARLKCGLSARSTRRTPRTDCGWLRMPGLKVKSSPRDHLICS